jgi:hypothetical protein
MRSGEMPEDLWRTEQEKTRSSSSHSRTSAECWQKGHKLGCEQKDFRRGP